RRSAPFDSPSRRRASSQPQHRRQGLFRTRKPRHRRNATRPRLFSQSKQRRPAQRRPPQTAHHGNRSSASPSSSLASSAQRIARTDSGTSGRFRKQTARKRKRGGLKE